MPQRQICFLVVLLTCTIVMQLLSIFASLRKNSSAAELPRALTTEDRLATGQPFPFKEADLFDLELIEGISDQRGLELLQKRQEILQLARKLPPDRKHKAFEIAHGIGEKYALYLSKHLLLE